MNLCDNRELLEQAILRTSEHLHINPAIIEKDYYVTRMLKYLVKQEPNVIFKGGTSLSKCYKLIERFSEDIDLNYDNQGKKLTEGERRKFSNLIKGTGRLLNFELDNPDEVQSRRAFNRYRFRYRSGYALISLNPMLVVETAVSIKSFPTETKEADSFIYRYLKDQGQEFFIREYDMAPFNVLVQTKERTFVDKVFAVCDYYLLNRVEQHSRHLYDLYKLFPLVEVNEKLSKLAHEVRAMRKGSRMCLSAQDQYNIRMILQEIIDKDIYRKDYYSVTQDLLFENVEYESVIENLQEIAELYIWND